MECAETEEGDEHHGGAEAKLDVAYRGFPRFTGSATLQSPVHIRRAPPREVEEAAIASMSFWRRWLRPGFPWSCPGPGGRELGR